MKSYVCELNSPGAMAQTVTLLIYMREMLGSNLDRDIGCSFPKSSQVP
jgi:hypothetical protein